MLYRVGSIQYTNAKLYTSKPFQWSDGNVETLGVEIQNGGNVSNNYGKIIGKMERVTKLWYNRRLSWVGKVLVINALVSSLLVYRMTVLPSPTPKEFQTMDEILLWFLWSDKRAKLPLRVLQNRKEAGGLKLTHFRYKDKSLKLQWVRRLLTRKIVILWDMFPIG